MLTFECRAECDCCNKHKTIPVNTDEDIPAIMGRLRACGWSKRIVAGIGEMILCKRCTDAVGEAHA